MMAPKLVCLCGNLAVWLAGALFTLETEKKPEVVA